MNKMGISSGTFKDVYSVLIDEESTSEVMSLAPHPLFGFNANPEYSLGKIRLPVRAGSQTVDVEFVVVKLPSPYNLIMRRTWLHTIQVIPSTYHQLLRFPTEHGIEQIRGSQQSAQACYLLSGKTPTELQVNSTVVPSLRSIPLKPRKP